MPGAINLPLPGVWRFAPDFDHHRKVAALVRYEVHAIDHMTSRGGSRVSAYCQICQLTDIICNIMRQTGEVRGPTGPDSVRPPFPAWVGWPWPLGSSVAWPGTRYALFTFKMESRRPWP